MSIRVGNQEPRLRDLRPDGDGSDQRRRRVMSRIGDQYIWVRANLQAVGRITCFAWPPGAGTRQLKRVQPGEVRRLASQRCVVGSKRRVVILGAVIRAEHASEQSELTTHQFRVCWYW